MKIIAQLTVAGEMVPGNGEDSKSHMVTEDEGYIGVFDGCGGLGSKRYDCAKGHTGAYLASRLAARRVWELERKYPGYLHKYDAADKLQRFLASQFKTYKACLEDSGTAFKMKGDLQKSLPTTAVIAAVRCHEDGIDAKYLWAGDSRGYILTQCGLAQVTADDIEGDEDALSNLSGDARLKNMLNADVPFVLNEKQIEVHEPCILLAATDGVFGYIATPMEFEYLLLWTLNNAKSLLQWEESLKREISKFASDDFTLSMVVCGFKNFEDLRAYFYVRQQEMFKQYIHPMKQEREAGLPVHSEELWQRYKVTYEAYL